MVIALHVAPSVASDPFARLPIELRHAIATALPDASSALTLLLLSRSWYNALIDAPAVWAHISWTDARPTVQHVHRLGRVLRLSKSALLHLRVANGFCPHHAMTSHSTGLMMLRPHLQRVRSLELEVQGHVSLQSILGYLDAIPVPNLETLVVRSAEKGNQLPPAYPWLTLNSTPLRTLVVHGKNTLRFLAAYMPNGIDTLDVQLVTAEEVQLLLTVIWKNASTLKTIHVGFEPLATDSSSVNSDPVGETVNFPGSNHPMVSYTEPCYLPELRELHVKGPQSGSFTRLLRAPRLQC